ncbi:hypothetical protein ACHAXA_007687 [Cyclostephanos tholiformis]|uniref:Uncharacterized protein n=1 Tax=Cyclostephanos tholiformis TaxID=382380 RepID=A0ABD3SDE2_9STRA
MGKDNPTSDGGRPSHLDPLHKTIESLREIRAALLPFIRLLDKDDDDPSLVGRRRMKRKSACQSSPPSSHTPCDSSSSQQRSGKKKRGRHDDDNNDRDRPTGRFLDPHRRAEAEAAVALAVGTLRYMGARLRGSDVGRRKGDPLRVELDGLRAALVSLRELEGAASAAGEVGTSTNVDADAAVGVSDDGVSRGGGIGPSKKKQREGVGG